MLVVPRCSGRKSGADENLNQRSLQHLPLQGSNSPNPELQKQSAIQSGHLVLIGNPWIVLLSHPRCLDPSRQLAWRDETILASHARILDRVLRLFGPQLLTEKVELWRGERRGQNASLVAAKDYQAHRLPNRRMSVW